MDNSHLPLQELDKCPLWSVRFVVSLECEVRSFCFESQLAHLL